MSVAKDSLEINDFHKSLQLLAKQLDKKDYSFVAGVMFRLYMGMKFDYLDQFDPNVMHDIKMIWHNFHERKVKRKAKLLQLNVVKGGKDEK